MGCLTEERKQELKELMNTPWFEVPVQVRPPSALLWSANHITL
jgi:hypothetical protein